ncbi:MAG TPA: serine hydrolase domain-containing protein [Polyangiaceae bacterium]
MKRTLFVISVATFCSACAPRPAIPSATSTAILAPTSAPAPSASPPPPSSPSTALSSRIDPLFAPLTKTARAGCALGIYRAGEVLFSRGYGLANLELDVPLATDDVFDVASISKQFTALAVLLLEHEGRLSLEDDVRKYVPEIPDYGRPLRIRHLLHHTGGLREYNDLLPLAGRENDRVTDDDLLRLLHVQKAPNFAPGTRFEYSNMGYAVLAVVVKRVSGMPFSAFAKQRIFDPLEMKNTTVLDDHHAVVQHRATGYVAHKGGAYTTAVSRWEHPGPSRVGTTIDDLAKWDTNFYEPRVGDRAILQELRTPGTLDDGKPLHYAAGLFVETRKGRVVEEHSGSTGGYQSELIRYPNERITIACLCNAESDPDADPFTLANAVSAIALPPQPSRARDAGASSVPVKPSYEGTDADFDEVVGAYYNPLTFDLRTARRDGGHIVLGYGLEPGGRSATFTPDARRSFLSADGTTHYRFQPGAVPSLARLVRSSGNDPDPEMTFVRFEPAKIEAAKLFEYAGRYTSDEVAREVELSVVDGKLRIATWGHAPDPEPLSALARDLFHLGEGGVQFERDARGRIRGFSASSYGYHGIRFVRSIHPPSYP